MNMNIYMSEVSQLLSYMSSDELKNLLNNDDQIEERVNDAVSLLPDIKKYFCE